MARQHDSGSTIGIQVGDSSPEIHTDLSADDCCSLVARHDERLADSMRQTESRIAAVTEEVLPDPDMLVEYYLLAHSRSRTDELLELDLEDLQPDEDVTRIDQYHRYTDVGSALLYEHNGFGGKKKFFSATWPNFKWSPYRFNDKASSAKAWGGNIIFEHTWYRGRRLYLIGIPYVEFTDLKEFNFGDIASSFISIP